MKNLITSMIIENNEISPGIYDMRLAAGKVTPSPGQFFMLYTGDRSRLLPRPISVCDYDNETGILRLVYRVAGKGTEQFSHLKPGDIMRLAGPLGNGFPIGGPEDSQSSPFPGNNLPTRLPPHAVLIGGGIGLPPLLFLGRRLKSACRLTALLGYRDSHMFMKDEFEMIAETRISTDDGSFGIHGTVMDLISDEPGLISDNSVIYACGPGPMLKAIQKYAAGRSLECYISLEERMACGVGACLSCVCRTTERDPHSNVNNARICVDGPVFPAGKVVLG